MKSVVLITSLLLLSPILAISQDKTLLIGAWYGKLRSHEFKQDGTAQFYSKVPVTNYKQKLIIDNELNYTFIEFTGSDTITNKGHVNIKSDTITFAIPKTNNNDYRNYSTLQFFLFHLDSSQLIYSNYIIEKQKEEKENDDTRFKPIEVEAKYPIGGKNYFLKYLYTALAKIEPESKDSVFNNSFMVTIDEKGKVDTSTMTGNSSKPKYVNAVKLGFGNLKSDFTPAMQNGRPVSAWFRFKITY